jgi:hypothetical protein
MVAKRPWERVVFDVFETTETSRLTHYYNEIIENEKQPQEVWREQLQEAWKEHYEKQLQTTKVLSKKKNSGKKGQNKLQP